MADKSDLFRLMYGQQIAQGLDAEEAIKAVQKAIHNAKKSRDQATSYANVDFAEVEKRLIAHMLGKHNKVVPDSLVPGVDEDLLDLRPKHLLGPLGRTAATIKTLRKMMADVQTMPIPGAGGATLEDLDKLLIQSHNEMLRQVSITYLSMFEEEESNVVSKDLLINLMEQLIFFCLIFARTEEHYHHVLDLFVNLAHDYPREHADGQKILAMKGSTWDADDGGDLPDGDDGPYIVTPLDIDKS